MEQIGRYQIVGELGRGAMGVVYRALDPKIGRTIAIKTIRLGGFLNEKERNELRRRLYREAQSAGILSHPGIVTIYDVAEEDENAYVFMEFVDGPTLEAMLDSAQPPSNDKLLDILRQVATALDYAHGKGIIHRDIKPANIMVAGGTTAKITDFGVARMQSQTMTSGGIMGTPNYMSPEQIRGEAVDGKADQFSLAVIVYELLTGEKPFSAESMATLLFKIVKEEPTAPQRLNPTLGPAIDAVLKRSMHKDPTARYATCTEFIDDLARAVSGTAGWRPMAPGASQSMPTLGAADAVALKQPDPSPEAIQTVMMEAAKPSPPEPPVALPPLSRESGEDVEATRRTVRSGDTPARASASQAGVPLTPAPAPLPEPRAVEKDPEENDGPSAAQKALVAALAVAVLALAFFLMKPYLSSDRGEVRPKVAKSDQPPPPAPIDPTKPSAMPEPVPVAQKPANADSAKPSNEAEVRPKSAEEPSKPNEAGDSYEVTSIPAGADVVFDADPKKSCTTPCRMALSSGGHSLVAKKQGYASQLRRFQFPNEAEAVLTLEEQSGTLYISTVPAGATITVDGEARTEKTPASIKLPVGEHRLEISKDGYRAQSDTVRVRDGAMAHLEIGLSPQ